MSHSLQARSALLTAQKVFSKVPCTSVSPPLSHIKSWRHTTFKCLQIRQFVSPENMHS